MRCKLQRGAPPLRARVLQSVQGMRSLLRALGADAPASLVVFLVAMPLSMGIALASGAPIVSGLVAAVVGGLIVGPLSGAPLQVSGPAAGLAVIVFGDVEQFGLPLLATIVIAAGVLQVALGALGVARATTAISPAVIQGMLAGIGIQIALSQLHVVLGGAPQSSAIQNLAELPMQLRDLHGPATMLGLATLVLLFLWPLLPRKVVDALPSALVAVTVTTVASLVLGLDVPRVDLPDDLLAAFVRPALPQSDFGPLALAAVTMALVASAESLLCAQATDKLHHGPRANLDRELMAQGVGNVCSGLFGGLPITGVIVRSSANITAGARTRMSAILHGAWVLVFSLGLGFVLESIPLAALAGLLIHVGIKLVNAAPLRLFIRHREAPAYFVTVLGVVLFDLLTGILLGIGCAIILLLRRRMRIEVVRRDTEHETHLKIRGELSFLAVPKLSAALAAVPSARRVRLELDVGIIDHAGFEALQSWKSGHERTGGHVTIDVLGGGTATTHHGTASERKDAGRSGNGAAPRPEDDLMTVLGRPAPLRSEN